MQRVREEILKIIPEFVANINKTTQTTHMTKEFMTRHEREKMARHQAVCERWKELRSNPEYADIAPSRIYGKVADEMGLTPRGVVLILCRYGLYETKAMRQKREKEERRGKRAALKN